MSFFFYADYNPIPSFAYEIPVINYGTVVEIQSTRCNGITECWNDIDELECGFSTSDTILIGMLSVGNK